MDFPAATKERLEAALTSLELKTFRDDDDDVCVAFENCYCYFQIGAVTLSCTGTWNGNAADEETAQDMFWFANSLNARGLVGACNTVQRPEGVSMHNKTHFLLGEGASDPQLSEMLDTWLQTVIGMCAQLEEQYPQLVTWESEEN